MKLRVAFVVPALCAALVACRDRGSKERPAPPPAESGGPVPGFALPPRLPAPLWKPLADPGAIGMPSGCTIQGPIRRTPLPAGKTRFFAPPGNELVMGTDDDGDGQVDQDVVLDTAGVPSVSLPWGSLDAPPMLAKTKDGYFALAVESAGGGLEQAVVWREPGRLELVAGGEKLEAVDARCEGGTCALLLTRAAKTAGPGATLLVGHEGADVKSWTRTDLPGEEKGFSPFSIVAIRGTAATVAMAAGPVYALWRVEAGKAQSQGTITTPFGAYDVALGEVPFAVSPGRAITEPCTVDGFSVRLIAEGGKTAEVDGQVPPSQVITRRTAGGFVVGWLAPVSCRHEGKSVVRAFLVDEKGVPTSSTMAVADADGFAIGTDGERLDLWLSRHGELVWVRATCRASTTPAAPPPSGSAARGN